MNNEEGICPVCHGAVLADYYFCPNCGNNLKEAPAEITPTIQLGLYALAIFLPPLGFWPGIKYLMKKDPEAKKLGGIVVLITLISTILTTWWIFKLLGDYVEILNGLMY